MARYRQLFPTHLVCSIKISVETFKNSVKTAFLAIVFMSAKLGADVCTYVRPKPLTHICGLVVDYQGRPIPEARVAVSHDSNELAVTRTTDSGEFDFRTLPNGRYDVLFESRGFRRFQFVVTVSKTVGVCTRYLRVKLTAGAPLHNCEEVQVVKKRK